MGSPKISVWFTSTGRFKFLKPTVETFLEKNTYPNVEFLFFESVPTEESKKYFDTNLIETDKCVEFLNNLNIPNKHVWIEPWPPYGNILQKFLEFTDADYYISLEDDVITVCDPKDQFLDGIQLIKDDPQLLGLRMDLLDPTTKEGNPRFKGTKYHTVSNYLYWPVASGAQLTEVKKMKSLGGHLTNHSLLEFVKIESHQNQLMVTNNMYIGLMLKYYGAFAHIGSKCVDGRDRTWSSEGYKKYIEKGWYGKR